ncbi:MAG: hypothetical protein ACAH59_10635 [Pseudobdellovibrionaceae bacterium]
MIERHKSLIWISVDLMAGLSRLQKVIHQFQSLGEVTEVSSIYKKYLNQRSEDLNSELVLVAKVDTTKNLEDIFHFLHTTENQQRLSSPSLNLILLTIDGMVRLFPGQNLPSPLLHTDALTLRCASEAWGDYIHPVLGQTLNQLVRSMQPLSHVEFFAQGRSLFISELE